MGIRMVAMLQHRHVTKIYSIVLGYSIWFCIAQYQTVTHHIDVPVYVYDNPYQDISTVESVKIRIQGPRSDMYHFNHQQCALHLDGSILHPGTQQLTLSKENLFLPDTVKLVDLIPSYITIHVNSIEKK